MTPRVALVCENCGAKGKGFDIRMNTYEDKLFCADCREAWLGCFPSVQEMKQEMKSFRAGCNGGADK